MCMGEDTGTTNPDAIAELSVKQIALQRFLDQKRNEIFSRFAKDRDYVAVTEKPSEKLHFHFFYTKGEMINFLRNEVTFAYDCRNSNQMILMF